MLARRGYRLQFKQEKQDIRPKQETRQDSAINIHTDRSGMYGFTSVPNTSVEPKIIR